MSVMSGLEAGRTVCTPQASPGLDASRGGPWRPVGALSQWRAVLLDMNGTFMFGGDRLGADDDHAGTYLALGGGRLAPQEVQGAVAACVAAFQRDYDDPSRQEAFPSLASHIEQHSGVPADERDRLALTIAQHERGHVPDWASRAITVMATQTRVGLVSNLWAPAAHWTQTLASSGVWACMSVVVFSTDLGAVKPSLRPFEHALAQLKLSPHELLFVGDSVPRDIEPAKRLGMATCLVGQWAPESVTDHCVARLDALVA